MRPQRRRLITVGQHDEYVVAQRRPGSQRPYRLQDSGNARGPVGGIRRGGDRAVVAIQHHGAGVVGAGEPGDDVLQVRGRHLAGIGVGVVQHAGVVLHLRRQPQLPQLADEVVDHRSMGC